MDKQEASKKVATLVAESRQKMADARLLANEHGIPFSCELWASVNGEYTEENGWSESAEEVWDDSWQSSDIGC